MSKLSDMLLDGVMEDMSKDGYIQSNTIDRTADTDWWGQAFINAVHDKIGDVAVPRAVIFWSFFLVLSVAEGIAWKQLKKSYHSKNYLKVILYIGLMFLILCVASLIFALCIKQY